MQSSSNEKISVAALVLLITGAIDSIRNLPTTALFGSKLIFFFVFASLIFLIPVALISAELASTWSDEEGGVYSWIRHAFGETVAFFAIWLQWVNTMVWYPTILLFIAGTLVYLIDPSLASHKGYLITSTLIIFWFLTALGLKGLHASAKFAGWCAILGMILPMGLLIFFAILWIVQQHPIMIQFDWQNMLPQWKESQSWASLTAMVTSFLGMELAAVHVLNVNNPQKNFPRAMFFSVLLILGTMILGSLAVAFVLPQAEMSLLQGVMQTFSTYLKTYHLHVLLPIIMIMLLLGSLGGMVNWIISPAKGLLMAADHGFLPKWLHKRNEKGIASRILILQALLVTLLCGGYILLPTVNGIYWLFTALSTELYLMMYILMFLAAIRLKKKFKNLDRPFRVPGGDWGYYLTCALGLLGCFISFIVGFIPPEAAIKLADVNHFRLIFVVGIVLMLLPAIGLYGYKRYMHR